MSAEVASKKQLSTPSHIKVIAGPTASGKSAFALDLAARENGVVINADSMQVYKDLPILTAQPSAHEQSQAPHQLYGFLDGAQRCNAAKWAQHAKQACDEALQKNQTPLLTGGTGFYISALMEGLSPIPDIEPKIRDLSISLLEHIGANDLYALMSEIDPEHSAQLHENDGQRLAHSWAVYEQTGQKLSYWQSLPKVKPYDNWHFDVHLILPDRDVLKQRIEARFERMLDMNVMGEVVALHKRIEANEVSEHAAIVVAHGFRALRAYHKGEITLDKAKEIGINDTKRYAKRQFTWFKHQIRSSSNVAIHMTEESH